MPKNEKVGRIVESQKQMARDLASGKFKGDVYIDGKPAPRQSTNHATIALMDRMDKLAELNKEAPSAIK